MDPEPSPGAAISPRRRWQIWLLGIFMGDAAIGFLFIASWLLMRVNGLELLGAPSLFLVPAVGGFVASYFWRALKPGIWHTVLNTGWMTLLALALATLVFKEGIICVLIVSPLLYAALLAGALLGRLWFRADLTRLRVSLLPVLAAAVLGEPFVRLDKEGLVTDELLIHAPPAKVWPQLTAFPDIPAAPRFWLFRLGLPYPVATTSAGDFVGADRRCIFSQRAVFKERVSELVPEQCLTFEILESPPDPELVGHLTPRRGQFTLRDNGDGTTTLIGSTWYTLHVRPLWYFDLWTHHIFRSVHLRVMEDIRRRAEAA